MPWKVCVRSLEITSLGFGLRMFKIQALKVSRNTSPENRAVRLPVVTVLGWLVSGDKLGKLKVVLTAVLLG